MPEENKIDNQKKLVAAIEAILFVYGEPLEIKRVAKILAIKEAEVETALGELSDKLKDESRGLTLIREDPGALNKKVQLATKKEFTPLLENFIKEEFKENLTPASLETLSLIAYLAPVSRSEIDYYRGVNSSFILRSLLLRGLIDRFLNPQKGNVYLYQPSFDLLKYLGISKIEELPEYEKFRGMIQSQEQGQNQQAEEPSQQEAKNILKS